MLGYSWLIFYIIIGHCDVKRNVPGKNHNVSFEGLDIHYHKYHISFYQHQYGVGSRPAL
jgi:hypothetical protein